MKNRLEDLCPVALHLDHAEGQNRVLRVTKYLGESHKLSPPFPFAIIPRAGIACDGPVQPSTAPQTRPTPDTPWPAERPTAPTAVAPDPAAAGRKPINFSSVIRFPE